MRSGHLQEAQISRYAPRLNPKNREALRVWNQLGGLDWAGLPIVLALDPVEDVRGLLERLYCIRDSLRS